MNMNNQKPKSKTYYVFIRIISVILIILSLLLSIVNVPLALVGICIGCWEMHYCAKAKGDTKPFYKKGWQIFVIVLFLVLSISAANISKNIKSIILETDLSQELQVPNSKDILISYEPADADNAEDIACYVSDTKIADLKLKSSDNGKITYELIPKAKGKSTIKCTAGDYQTTFEFAVSTSELEAKEAAEKKAEAERLAAEKAEAERIAAEQKIAQEQQQKQMVYVTPSGKRYHLDANCGGKNSYQIAISDIGGRTPCKKCANVHRINPVE